MIEIKTKNAAIVVAVVLSVLMLFSVIVSITVTSANAASTDVYLTVEETTSPSSALTLTAVQDEASGGKSSVNSSTDTIQTGRAVCIFSALALGASLTLTVCLERKRRINEPENKKNNIIYFNKESLQ